jgi:acyl dehydratase
MAELADQFEAAYSGQTRESLGRTITTADILSFAGVSGDFAQLHVNREFARTTEYERPIAHGLLTLVVSTTLASAARPFRALASYGYERVRFVAPVFPGDTLAVRVTVGAVSARDGGRGTVAVDYETVNQDGTTVMVCTHLLLVDLANALQQPSEAPV